MSRHCTQRSWLKDLCAPAIETAARLSDALFCRVALQLVMKQKKEKKSAKATPMASVHCALHCITHHI
jgi:hypothetical protein